MTKTYLIVCPSCNGEGYIISSRRVSSQTTDICKACNGSGVVMCTEADND